MSDSFDPSAIANGVYRRHDIGVAARLNRRLVDCEPHDDLYALFDKLEEPTGKLYVKPSEQIEAPMTIYTYGKDGERNLRLDEALDCAVRYHFPEGLTVTRLRKNPITFRLDDELGHQLLVRRRRDVKRGERYWEVMSKSGWNKHSGKRAGTRHRGKAADRSFD